LPLAKKIKHKDVLVFRILQENQNN